jgi:hypothetical protein
MFFLLQAIMSVAKTIKQNFINFQNVGLWHKHKNIWELIFEKDEVHSINNQYINNLLKKILNLPSINQ